MASPNPLLPFSNAIPTSTPYAETYPVIQGPKPTPGSPISEKEFANQFVQQNTVPRQQTDASFWDQIGPAPKKKTGRGRRRIEEGAEPEEPVVVGKRPPGPEAGDRRERRDIVRTPTPNEWRSRVHGRASWRGVEFELESYTLPIGRKSFVHEFAQSSGIYVEDNGRETRYHRLRGFVIGDDYDLQRDALVRALETEGPGDLIHPYFGLRRCKVIPPCSVTENTRENRIAMFDLVFVDVDDGVFPREITDFPAAVVTTAKILTAQTAEVAVKAESLFRARNEAFAAFAHFTRFQADVENSVIAFLGLAISAFTPEFADEFASALLTLNDAKLLVSMLKNWLPAPATDNPDEERALGTFSTWARSEIEARAAVIMATTDYPSYDAAILEASSLFEQIQVDEYAVTDAGVYEHLVDLRIFLFQAIYNLSDILPREREIVVQGVIPAIVIAYNLYEDPLRDQEIIRRNRIIHPNFVSGAIQVLDR